MVYCNKDILSYWDENKNSFVISGYGSMDVHPSWNPGNLWQATGLLIDEQQ
jgi:hypothetical protein